MSRKSRTTASKSTAPHPDLAVAEAPDVEPPELADPSSTMLQADHDLAQRCAKGVVAAWEELFARYQGSLVRTIQILLRSRTSDANLADEIAGEVWYALVANDGELLNRYDPRCGARLITYLRAIARDHMGRHFRSERRRNARECEVMLTSPRHHSEELDQFEPSLDEFLAALAPSERQFCSDYLMRANGEPSSIVANMSRANVWQKTHRIYRRFLRYFQNGD